MPHTFDAASFTAAMGAARDARAATLPTYSRVLSDPVPGGATLAPRHRAVLVEGSYVLLGALLGERAGAALAAYEPDADAPRAVADEARRWAELLPLFDELLPLVSSSEDGDQRFRTVGLSSDTP